MNVHDFGEKSKPQRRMADSAMRVAQKVFAVAMVVGLLNFLLFVAGTFYFGGDAVNGKTEQGRYYLWATTTA